MPQDVGSLGFDTGLWVGLGIVGLWSALDAFAERAGIRATRCAKCGRNCLLARLLVTGRLNADDELTLKELEDLRHLFAHNYAGRADAEYFKKKRHVLAPGVSLSLSSGAVFDGANISLTATHLRYNAERSRAIINKLA